MGTRSPAQILFRILAALAVVVLCGSAVLVLAAHFFRASIEGDHTRFADRTHLGMTEQQALAAVGKPNYTFTFAEAGPEVDRYFGDGSSPGYYHTWHGVGRLPLEFHHAAKYSHSIAWGDYLFYDDTGKVICILSGSS